MRLLNLEDEVFNFLKKKDDYMVEEMVREIECNFNDASKVFDFFKQETGIDFDKKRNIVTGKIVNFCKKRGFCDFDSFLRNLTADKDLKQELVDYLSVNETYFYREMRQIDLMVQRVKSSFGSVKILSLPSSSGEEPYTIAMALFEADVDKSRFEITGVDINSAVIDHAKRGVYAERSLHRVPDAVKMRYFKKIDEDFLISDEIKDCVDFKVLNIFDENFKNIGEFDYIFCRNMLIYFDDDTKRRAVNILKSVLKDKNGEIYFGHADLPAGFLR